MVIQPKAAVNKFFDSGLHIIGSFINPHYAVIFGAIGQVCCKYFGWHFQSENIALLPYLNEHLSVFPCSCKIIADGF